MRKGRNWIVELLEYSVSPCVYSYPFSRNLLNAGWFNTYMSLASLFASNFIYYFSFLFGKWVREARMLTVVLLMTSCRLLMS